MDSYDIDLEDLDLKSVDIGPNTTVTSPSNFKNVSFNSGSAFTPTNTFSSKPNLTISSSNNDPMPSMGGLSSDKEVDFGLNLLVNKKKQRPESEINKLGSNSTNPSPSFGNNKNNFNSFNSLTNDNSMPQSMNIDDSEFLQNSLFDDNFSNIDLDKELNTMDLNDISPPKPSMNGPSLPNFGSSNTNTFGTSNFGNSNSSGNGSGNGYNGFAGGAINTGGVSSTENLSFEEIQKRKFDLLCKFERLRDKGVKLPKTFSMSSSYEEMNQEYDRLVYHRKMENSVKMQRRMLVSFASMAEFVNNKTGNPFDVNLDGWSEHMNEEINNYDEIFENLYDKHKDTIDMAPELKLVFMVASSAFWYHISNNMAKSVMPNMDMNKIFKQNPDLMNQFKNAAMGSMSQTNPGFTNFMGSVGSMGGGGPPKYNPMNSPPFSNPRDAPPRGSTNINSSDDIDALIDSINA
jgi:hypothetical protein